MARYFMGATEPSRYLAVQPDIGWDVPMPVRAAGALVLYIALRALDELAFHKRLEGAAHLLMKGT